MATLYAKAAGGNWNAAGTWSNTSSAGGDSSGPPAAGDDVIFDSGSGNVVVNAQTNGLGSLVMTGYTGTLSGTSIIVLTGVNSTTKQVILDGTYTHTGLLYFTCGGTGRLINFTTNGRTPTTIQIHGADLGRVVLQDNLIFAASKTCGLIIETGSSYPGLDLNGKTISGDSVTNRLLCRAVTSGVARGILVNSGTFANCDFKDINFNNSGVNLDLSNISGLSGDLGNNGTLGGGALILTPSNIQNITMSSNKSWSDPTIWSDRIPLPQDDVTATGWSAGTLTIDVPRIANNVSFSGATPGRTLSANTIAMTIFGSLDLTNISTFTTGSTGTWTFSAKGPSTLKSNGRSFATTVSFAPQTSITLLDNYTQTSFGNTSISSGTFDANGFNVVVNGLTSSGIRTIKMGSGTWTMNQNTWSMTLTSLTLLPGTSTLQIGGGSGNATFAGGGATYNNIIIKTSSNTVTISGSNIFNIFKVEAPKNLVFTAGTTQTVNDFIAIGLPTNLITITSSSSGSAATISKASGIVSCDWMSVKDSTVTGGASWYAGSNSSSVSGNSGWSFTSGAVSGKSTSIAYS